MNDALYMAQLRERASAYYPELQSEQLDVVLRRTSRRPASDLHYFELTAAGEQRFILLKQPKSRPEAVTAAAQRPRLNGDLEPARKVILEHAALRAIQEHFSALADSRFRTVRVLDLLPSGALVLEEVREPNLRQLIGRFSPAFLRDRDALCEDACRNAGAWLREFHGLSAAHTVETGRGTLAAFCDRVGAVAGYLGRVTGDRAFFEPLSATTIETAARVLPETLPLGTTHGDFTLRNILVDELARVTVIDTLARFRNPIYQDIGYFAAGLADLFPWQIGPVIASEDPTGRAYEDAFLAGYFGAAPVPRAAVYLFALKALLERWSSLLAHASGAAAIPQRTIAWTRMLMQARRFRAGVKEYLAVAGH